MCIGPICFSLKKMCISFFYISTVSLQWTSIFGMLFIPSKTNPFKPHPHMCDWSKPMPSNSVACLLTFVWRWTRIAMTLKAGILYPPAEKLLPVWDGQWAEWAELSYWPGHCPNLFEQITDKPQATTVLFSCLKNDNIFKIIIGIFLFWKNKKNKNKQADKNWMKTWLTNAAFFNEFDCHQYNIWLFFIFIIIHFFSKQLAIIIMLNIYALDHSRNLINIILPKMLFWVLIHVTDLDLCRFLNKTLSQTNINLK